jgi:LPS export ABC transporter protein LptC
MKISLKILYAALFTGCIFLFSCENDRGQVNNLAKRDINNKEEATFVKINYTVGGKTKAIVTAPLMVHVSDTAAYYEFPKSLYAEFYNLQAQKETVLTANYGTYKEIANIIYLRDSVKIINLLKKDTIYCEDLYWDSKRIGQEFYTSKKVRIRQPDGQYLNLAGGMEADQALKNIHMNKGVGATNYNGGVGVY